MANKKGLVPNAIVEWVPSDGPKETVLIEPKLEVVEKDGVRFDISRGVDWDQITITIEGAKRVEGTADGELICFEGNVGKITLPMGIPEIPVKLRIFSDQGVRALRVVL